MPWKAVVVTSYAACRHVLADPVYEAVDAAWRDRIAPGWRANSSVVPMHCALPTTNPPAHAALRKIVTAGLSRQDTAARKDQLAATAGRCLDEVEALLAAYGSVDLVPALSERFATESVLTWLGLPVVDADRLAGLTRRWSVAYELAPSAAQLADADVAHEALRTYLLPHLEHRLRAPGDGAISRWLRPAPDGGGLDLAQALTETTVLMLGAKDISALITEALLALLEDPSVGETLRQGPRDASAVAEDITRRRPPVSVVTRVTARDTALEGVPIEAGRIVHALIRAAHQDPAATTSSLTFGAGVHYCPGAPLARLHLETLLPLFACRLPGLRLIAPPTQPEGVAFPHVPRLLVIGRPAGRTEVCPPRPAADVALPGR
ncbi:cytochrome P450 [Streptomyces hundungensis]|uniref:cytochrome P450 n=1 Tax=Streptomyces hundungensis TaxID=1077946 RepID=UPI0033D2CCF6